jgi:hypothetical protein
MNPVPALMSLWADAFPHFGQVSSGGSVIRWISSHSLPQAVQPYS